MVFLIYSYSTLRRGTLIVLHRVLHMHYSGTFKYYDYHNFKAYFLTQIFIVKTPFSQSLFDKANTFLVS